uniref:Uncharacterized protein n=1 Tax=Picea glauca TaxID=3330 RepID=A0A101M016_PICGL|nr:hypothetical protein ABT39_MTgene5407 [Picea glauca]
MRFYILLVKEVRHFGKVKTGRGSTCWLIRCNLCSRRMDLKPLNGLISEEDGYKR